MLISGTAKKIIWIAMLLGFFFAPLPSLWAGGAKEDPIAEAKVLIEQKDYEKAYRLLASVIRDYPDRQDEAEALLVMIRNRKGDYNQQLQDLITNLKDHPEDSKTSLAIISKLTALDPSQRSRTQVEAYRVTAQLQEDRYNKSQIMKLAREQLAQNQYMSALATYFSGFTLQRSDFLLGPQTDAFKKQTTGLADQIASGIEEFQGQINNLVPLLDTFNQGLNQDSADSTAVDSAFSRLATLYLETVKYPVQIETSTKSVSALRNEVEKDYHTYNEYIRFIQEFMAGPPDAKREGIAYAARSQIDTIYKETLDNLEGLYQQAKKNIADEFSRKNYAAALGLLDAYKNRGRLYVRALSLRSGKDPGAFPRIATLEKTIGRDFSAASNQVLLEMDAHDVLKAAMQIRIKVDQQKKTANNAEYPVFFDLYDQSLKVDQGWNTLLSSLGPLQGLDEKTQSSISSLFSTFSKELSADALALGRAGFLALARQDYQKISDPHASFARRYDTARLNLDGIKSDKDGAVHHYPDAALKAFAPLETELLAYQKASLELDQRVLAQRQEIQSHGPVGQTLKSNQDLRKTVENELSLLRSRTVEAQGKVQSALVIKSQAEQTANQGRTYLDTRRLDLERADKAYQDAYDLFVKAYDIAYNDDSRIKSDQLLASFKQDIEIARQNVIVDSMNKKIREAEEQFSRELYSPALDAVGEAEALFKQTTQYLANPKARNEDIVYIKGRILAASTLSQARSLAESDPEFSTISEYLRMAFVEYQKVQQQISKNIALDQAAQVRIDRAKSYVSNVILLKPNLWDAKLLQLKLELLSDPKEFQSRYNIRAQDTIKTARESMQKGEPSVDAYTNLQALQEINPGYPGMADVIFAMEIALGYRENPADVAQRKESERLYQLALRLSTSKAPDQLNQALDYLADALKANRKNDAARALANEVRQKIGSITVTLSAEDERTFRKAESLFVAGSYTDALAITTQLIEKGNNKYSAALIDLLKRINQKLGS